MDFSHGLGLFFIGCTLTLLGFFTAFLVINYNKKKEDEKIKRKKETIIHPYGDDTVWQKNIQRQIIGIEMLEQ